MRKEENQTKSVPPKTKLTYEGFKALSDESPYALFEAKLHDSHDNHLIKTFDHEKESAVINYNQSATLFLRELLNNQIQRTNSVLINRFEISNNGKQIACAVQVPLKKTKSDDYTIKKKAEIQTSIQAENRVPASQFYSNTLIPSKGSPSSQLMAWCSRDNNNIRIIDVNTKQEYASFCGVSLSDAKENSAKWTYVKEIQNTTLLVSLHYAFRGSSNMEIFDLSKKGKVRKIYSFEEVLGVSGFGDVTSNKRRSILGGLSRTGSIAYHLFGIGYGIDKSNYTVQLLRKSRWNSHHSLGETAMTSIDFDPNGDLAATIDCKGVCSVTDIANNSYIFHVDMASDPDYWTRCKWSTFPGEPIVFIKYDWIRLNILDVEKKALLLKQPSQVESAGWILHIEVSPVDGNIIVTGGSERNIKIYDRRASKVVRMVSVMHSDCVNCVRWNSTGELIGTACDDGTTEMLDFKTGKLIHTENTSDGNAAISVCFMNME